MTTGHKGKAAASSSNSNPVQVESDNDQSSSKVEDMIKTELKNRMLASGEWSRLTKKVREQLKGSSWEENLRCTAEARALEADEPSLGELIEYIQPIAADTVPEQIKNDIMASIRHFVEVNVDADVGETQ
ncbi:uncharacterized protein MELLADRAFT_62423 [Melampsora larici-populina 98AG31]|uniref:Transcription and mRNA export factor SUS1 n=1 Tax=Melampsora larici-populina (strain 98AG31 / pathotype 3-4-7) TaxID=747676 RepID=F4RIX0_MELLP|nr:uncharacterized protein MELLADRAFT_62423 [Melampsora larici-populina 98AG31]EGG07758.1 hypothetical protein MELLADRAFT_62423 [Melampsora larici-populina 98AG31]